LSVEPALLAGETAAPPPKRSLAGRLARDGSIVFGATVILLMALMGLTAPWLGTKNPSEIKRTIPAQTFCFDRPFFRKSRITFARSVGRSRAICRTR